MSHTFLTRTLGCKLNHYETEVTAAELQKLGYRRAEADEPVDLVIIDTCTVTDRADFKARQLIRQMQRRHPQARIVVAGCYAQSQPERVADMPHVDLVLGNREKLHPGDFLSLPAEEGGAGIYVNELTQEQPLEPAPLADFQSQTRAFLKIQDGCDVFCSFCIVPYTRGRSRSLDPRRIVTEARNLVSAGFRELVLTGVHIGDYGHDLNGEMNLVRLLQLLEAETGIERLRISSIEPWDITEPLIQHMAESPVLLPHIHTAVQSASDTVLKAMRRRIDRKGLQQLLEMMRHYLPAAGTGTDVLVGFPGETEEDFQQTVDFVRSAGFTYLHVFPYSERSGTRAARREDQLTVRVRKERAARMLELGNRLKCDFAQSLIGKVRAVLLESKREQDLQTGWTPEYVRVRIDTDTDLTNAIVPVELKRVDDDGALRGVVAAEVN